MKTETTTPEPPDVETQNVIENWEFVGEAPTSARVLELLATLPPVWGVHTKDFADYVQPLPQKKKVKRPNPQNPRVEITDSVQTYALYMSVAGRIKMLEQAQRVNGWTVNFRPEPTVLADCPPGYLRFSGSLLYRVYVEISTDEDNAAWAKRANNIEPMVCNGVRSGTSNITIGSSGISASNPWEKVETSALGRALAAWGFGVLPGSGVASLEEMQQAAQNERAASAQAPARRSRDAVTSPESRAELLSDAQRLSEDARIAMGRDQETWELEMTQYLSGIGASDFTNPDGTVDLTRVLPGALETFVNRLTEMVRQHSKL